MGTAFFEISVSLDGYVAGPDQSEENPLGIGGEGLHDWVLATQAWREAHGHEGGEAGIDDDVAAESIGRAGAVIMGRNMFGGGPGPWDADEPWQGWWGDSPPFHVPVFVLTHHEREPLTLGDTTFTFVTEGPEAAMAKAQEAAGERPVLVAGGADAAQQLLRAGLVDEIELHVAPILLGGGARLFEGLDGIRLEKTRGVESPNVTHLWFRVLR